MRLPWHRRGGRRWELRTRLAVAILSVGSLALVCNALVLSLFLNNYLVDQEGIQMAQQAAAIANCCRNPGALLAVLQSRALPQAMQDLLSGTPDRQAMMVDTHGRLLFLSSMPSSVERQLLARLRVDLSGPSHTPSNPPPWFQLGSQIAVDLPIYMEPSAGRSLGLPEAAINRLRANSPVRGPSGVLVGGLLLTENQHVVELKWRRAVILVEATGVAAVALATLGGLIAAHTFTRPVQAVTVAAQGIAAGDYRQRVHPEGPAELAELAQAFNTMVDEVVRRQRIERDLVANVSHELAGPLGLIRGYAEGLADGVIAGEKRKREALQAIGAESARLARISGDLLDLTLLETGQAPVHQEPVPVAELLAGLCERFGPSALEAGVALQVEASPDVQPLWTDGLRLEQVLVNLLRNALRYTPAGGTILLRSGQNGSMLWLAVADTGCGIPSEDLPRIWERFYRVEKGRGRRTQDGGAGLGLAICSSTIAVLGGSIAVESTVGRGTTFTIWLPLRAS